MRFQHYHIIILIITIINIKSCMQSPSDERIIFRSSLLGTLFHPEITPTGIEGGLH
jgi:hypothetical protein